MLAKTQTDLFGSLKKAYEKAADTGASSDPIPDLSEEVGNAVHEFIISAKVKTVAVVISGIAYNDPSAVVVPVATTTKPGSGEGLGGPDDEGPGISFSSENVSTLKEDLFNAYKDATELGAAGGDVAEQLSTDMSESIYKFAITANVETHVTIKPGQPIVGMMTGTPASPAPVVATTKEGTGKGIGAIS